MKRSMFVLTAALLLGAGAAQAADFALGFEGCPATVGTGLTVGTPFTFETYVTVTTTNNDSNLGAQGWSFGFQIEKPAGVDFTVDPASFKPVDPESDPPDTLGLNLQVSTLYDSDGDGDETSTPPGTPLKDPHLLWLYKAGFLVFENAYVTQKPDRPAGEAPIGVVSAIVLHQTKKMVLQPGAPNKPDTATQRVAKLVFKGTMPADKETVTLKFIDGLFGAGEAVANVVTYNSTSNSPTLGACEILLDTSKGPEPTYILALVDKDATDVGSGANNTIAKTVPADTPNVVTVDLLLKTENLPLEAGDVEPADGPQGWSVGLRHKDNMTLAVTNYVDIEGSDVTGPEIYPPIPGVSKVSTLYDNDADGGPNATPPGTPDIVKLQDLATAGFVVSEKAFVTAKATRPAGETPVGVVSAIVLHQTKKMVLQANATDKVLRMVFTMPAVAAGATIEGTISIEDGLFGSGEAVMNVITHKSTSMTPSVKRGLIIQLTGELIPVNEMDQFIRGDANNDGKVNIADVVWIVYTVVPGVAPGYSIACPDSGDANDDEALNISDAAFLIQYQFQGGSAPVAPLLECGSDDDANEVTCPKGTVDLCPTVPVPVR
jgi:hypothetical protein